MPLQGPLHMFSHHGIRIVNAALQRLQHSRRARRIPQPYCQIA